MAKSPLATIRNIGGLSAALTRLGQAASDAIYRPPSEVIPGIDTSLFPNPGQPVRPIAPAGSEPLAFPFQYATNLTYTPRADAEYSAEDLKRLAKYPLAWWCIENVKDIVSGLEWQIQPRIQFGEMKGQLEERARGDKNIETLTKFFERPDGEHCWSEWVRPLLDDMLVCDAPAVRVRRTKKGDVARLDVLPGHVICRYIDANGYTPQPPAPAYAQLWAGIPRVNMDTTQLVYKPRNIAPRNTLQSYLYGSGPVEQAAPEIEVGIKRLEFVTLNYTAGAIPGMLQVVPPGTDIKDIETAMKWMNSRLAGDLAARQQFQMAQGFNKNGADQFIQTQEKALADPFDDLHIRKICFAFGTSPQRLLKMMNRACHSADTETLTENGWKLFGDIADGEKVAQFDPITGGMEFVVPEERFLYPYSGEMVHFTSQNVDVLVTPEHNMWARQFNGRKRAWSEFRKVRAGAVKRPVKFEASAVFAGREVETFEIPAVHLGQAKLTLEQMDSIRSEVGMTQEAIGRKYGVSGPTVCLVQNRVGARNGCVRPGFTVKMDDWLEFLGYYLSEGGLSHSKRHYLLTLCQKDAANVAKIEACLSRLPFKWSRYPVQSDGVTRWNVYGKPLCEYLMRNTGGYCFDKHIPREFLKLSIRQVRILFDAMMLGDGSWVPGKEGATGSYATSSPRLRDDVQEMAFKLGYCAASAVNRGEHPGLTRIHHAMYRVNLCLREEHILWTTHNIRRENYDGPVWCFKVPTGLFVTRRNGKIAIHGNSSQSNQEAAQEEGTKPWATWLFRVFMNYILQVQMGFDGYEFGFSMETQTDPVQAATAAQIRITALMSSPNDELKALGRDPRPEPEADKLGWPTPAGWMAITQHAPEGGAMPGAPGGPGSGAPETKPVEPGAKPPKGETKPAADETPKPKALLLIEGLQKAVDWQFTPRAAAIEIRKAIAGLEDVKKNEPLDSPTDRLALLKAIEGLEWLAKYSDDQPRVPAGQPGGGEFGSGGGSSALVSAPENRKDWPAHIQELKLPPAWTGVRINPDPKAALQAIGKDAKGRDQYVYSKEFQDSQSAAKFARIQELDSKFDKIRAENDANLRSADGRTAEHAECASLVMSMGIRPGSEEDTRAKVQAYGATTLLGRHVVQEGEQTYLRFTGKKGVNINLPVSDSKIAGMIRDRAAAAGPDGQLFPHVSGTSLLEYTHQFDGGGFKTKDFRTLLGTREAAIKLGSMRAPSTQKEYVKAVRAVAEHVSSRLGNTPTVALTSYIHPAVFAPWRARLAA